VTERRAAARYAEALFGLAQEWAAVESVRAELRELVGVIAAAPSLQALLARPDLGPKPKLQAVQSALGDQFTDIVVGLLAALVRHRRGEYVSVVVEAFEEMADDAAGVVRAEAKTVVPLSDGQRERLIAALSRMTGRRVVLEERLDPGILAGMRVEVGGRLLDGSAAGRLARLREELMKPGL